MNLSLEKNDRICFLGDSITHGGLWIKEIFEYFINNYPELKIGFYNCGIGGSRGYEADIKNRLYCDCFNLFPKYTVVMFGMNDTFEFLGDINCGEEQLNKNRAYIVERFEKSLEDIVENCKTAGTVPIICAPTPYDEYSDFETVNRYADISLKGCRDVAEMVAEKHNLLFIDMRQPLMDNIAKKPVGEDRIHPNAYGQHLMAEQFLCAIGAKKDFEPEKPCVFSEKNEKRFKLEQTLRNLMYVERDYMGWQHKETTALTERKNELVRRYFAEGNDWSRSFTEDYLDNIDYLDELRGELVRQTVNIY